MEEKRALVGIFRGGSTRFNLENWESTHFQEENRLPRRPNLIDKGKKTGGKADLFKKEGHSGSVVII